MEDQKNIEAILARLIDKLNRIEANVANLKSDSQGLKGAIDNAVDKLITATQQLQPVEYQVQYKRPNRGK